MAAGYRSLVGPTIAMLVAMAVLLGLGTWQLQRKAWKDGLIAQIEARSHARPVALGDVLRRVAAGEDLEYLRVAAKGHWLADRERFVWAPSQTGSGWHVYVPLVLPDGRVVIVNRGLVAAEDRDRARRPEPAAAEVEIVGLLRKPARRGLFTPDNDVRRNAWYWRDLDGMATSMLAGAAGPDASRVVAFFLDAEPVADAARSPHAPRGGATLIDIPNNHLQYAVTWYGLGLALIGVYLAFCRSRLAADAGSGEVARHNATIDSSD